MNVAEYASCALAEPPAPRLRSSPAMRGARARDPRSIAMGSFSRCSSSTEDKPGATIGSMPGVFAASRSMRRGRECRELDGLGVKAVLLFGIPDFKDAVA